jgi:hypothetical protein
VPYVDGSSEILRIAEECGAQETLARACAEHTRSTDGLPLPSAGSAAMEGAVIASSTKPQDGEPPFEGALVGFRPYLYPLPVAAFFVPLLRGSSASRRKATRDDW